jgi:hypothetical protein
MFLFSLATHIAPTVANGLSRPERLLISPMILPIINVGNG